MSIRTNAERSCVINNRVPRVNGIMAAESEYGAILYRRTFGAAEEIGLGNFGLLESEDDSIKKRRGNAITMAGII